MGRDGKIDFVAGRVPIYILDGLVDLHLQTETRKLLMVSLRVTLKVRDWEAPSGRKMRKRPEYRGSYLSIGMGSGV